MQITEQKQITWEDFSRGFHGGRIDSEEIETFNFSDEKQYVSFSVREYTSDTTDFFGVCCPMWEILVWIREVRMFHDQKEYETEVQYMAGNDYCRAEYAQEFCEYILYSIKKHGNISRLPICERVED
jgi:hypothetical protein